MDLPPCGAGKGAAPGFFPTWGRIGQRTLALPFSDVVVLCLSRRLQLLRLVMRAQVTLWSEEGEDIAEYAVMVAVILLIVVGTLRLIGSNSNTVFSSVASAIG
jgi:Flp pilus assembly pilin Flp